MASALTHAFVAVALGTAYVKESMPWQFWALSVFCALLPDADVIGFAWGVGYDSL
jgi:inner membrane protein